MSLNTIIPIPATGNFFAAGKKIACRMVPLRELNLKRIPEQTYLGRVLYTYQVNTHTGHVVGTPHGLLFTARPDQLSEPTAADYHALESLEAEATRTQKNLYGGVNGLREYISQEKLPKQPTAG